MNDASAARQHRVRRCWGLIPVVAVLVGIILVLKLQPAPPSQGDILVPPLDMVGTLADPPQAAPDFTLVDQFGHRQTLSRFRGRAVALTFVYTHCPDVCPLIAANMHLAYEELGPQAARVALVAVTVDPERDTVEQIKAFSDAHHLSDEWSFLTGSRAEVQPVWSAYEIYVQPVNAKGTPVAPVSDSGPGSPDSIEHAAPVYVLDTRGTIRILLPPSFQSGDLVKDLRLLLPKR